MPHTTCCSSSLQLATARTSPSAHVLRHAPATKSTGPTSEHVMSLVLLVLVLVLVLVLLLLPRLPREFSTCSLSRVG